MGAEGLEPSRLLQSTDFKSAASTIPPRPLRVFCSLARFSQKLERIAITYRQLFHHQAGLDATKSLSQSFKEASPFSQGEASPSRSLRFTFNM
jgi:hypothetical protein